MRTFLLSKIRILLCCIQVCTFCLSTVSAYADTAVQTTVTGNIFLRVEQQHLSVDLNFTFADKRDSTNTISLLLTRDVQVQAISGKYVASFAIDTNARPFSIIRIKFRDSLPLDAATDFSMQYSGIIKKGFWAGTYNWIDLDPDFMNLPIFLALNNFKYRLKVASDNPAFRFCDFRLLTMAPSVEIISEKPSYYFNSIVAGKTANLKQVKQKGYLINIFSSKPEHTTDSLARTCAEIVDFYNKGFGKKDTVNSFLVVYRPLPDSVLPVIRSQDRSIVFSNNHSRTKVLAHEIGHFWWNRGNAFSTEKWLSESFAEYASFMFVRTQKPLEYEHLIAGVKIVAMKTPAIIGSDRFGEFGDDMLYFKGPYLLSELEKQIGQRQFTKFLDVLNQKKVETTKELLKELESMTSPKIRASFEASLNR